jgi:hypothetical protein
MRVFITTLFFVVVALAQKPNATPQKQKGAPRLAFVETANAAEVIDTDLFDAQKYVEESGSDSSAAKAKRAAHEADLTRDFMNSFNQTKECDGIVLMGKGDNKPDYSLQVIVDSHDTPGQKPVWIWILGEGAKNKFIAKGDEDTSALAAKGLCLAVWKAADADRAPKPQGSPQPPGK